MPITRHRFPVLTLALAGVSFAVHAQQSAPWAGWARCQITVQGPGYTDQQVQTWIMTGGRPTVEGAFRIYAGTWSVVGGGSLQKSQGTQALMAQWATNVQGMSSPIAVFVRASDGRMFISPRHAQLRAQGAVAGYQQITLNGKPQWPGKISYEAFEWAFPVANGPATSTTLSGSSTPPVNGSVGFMQPAGSQGTASCTWQFGQGSAAPPPPPALTTQTVPTPVSGGVATGQTSGPPTGSGGRTLGPATCAGGPQYLTATESTTTPGTVTMQWAAPASGIVNSYVILASSQAGGTPDLANFDTNSPSLSLAVPNVPAGTYYLSVVARSSCGLSPASNQVALVVGAAGGAAAPGSTPCPSPPQNLVGTVRANTPSPGVAPYTISLQWDPPVSGVATAYTIKAGTAPGLADLRNYTMASAQTYDGFGANPGTYYIRVNVGYSSCPAGGSSASNEVLVVVP